MKNKSYFRVVVAVSLVLAITTLVWLVLPAMPCYSQGGYGGGGGGGGAVGEPYPGLSLLRGRIGSGGVMTEDVIAKSFDGLVQLAISRGTKVLNRVGAPVYSITIFEIADPLPEPAGFKVIGLVYDFGPEGVTFHSAATVTFTYDEALLPKRFDEKNLVIAKWDEITGEWVMLDSTVDPGNNTVSAQVSYFTAFAILAGTAPAAVTVTDLAIAPGEVGIGEKVTISTLVSNTGYLSGSYEVILIINGEVVATEGITLPGLASEGVTFTIAEDVTGVYTVDVRGLTGTFEVSAAPTPPAPPVPTPPPPAPVPPPVPVINWYLVGSILAGCIIIGVIIWLAVRRRRAV